MMRKRFHALVPVAAAATLAIAGCGSSSSSGGSSSGSGSSSPRTPTVAANAIARAADVSMKESGYKFTMSLKESLPSLGGTITGTGSGTFNVAAHAGQVSLDMSLPGTAGAAGAFDIHEVFSGQNIYLELPALIASRLPGRKPWIQMNLAAIGKDAGLSGLTSLAGGGAGSSNPAQFLQYLEGTSADGVKNLGSATVDGVSTTHYQGTIDFAKAASLVPAAQRAAFAKGLASLKKLSGLSQLPVNVYIDSNQLVRRLQLAYSANVKGQSTGTNMQFDFSSYGAQPVPSAPPASEVSNLSSLLGGLSASGSSSSAG